MTRVRTLKKRLSILQCMRQRIRYLRNGRFRQANMLAVKIIDLKLIHYDNAKIETNHSHKTRALVSQIKIPRQACKTFSKCSKLTWTNERLTSTSRSTFELKKWCVTNECSFRKQDEPSKLNLKLFIKKISMS